MRHSVVTTKLVRQARAALDEEAAQRPVRNPEPQPPQEPPRSLAQEPINVGDRDYHPLYPYGWGLRTHARR